MLLPRCPTADPKLFSVAGASLGQLAAAPETLLLSRSWYCWTALPPRCVWYPQRSGAQAQKSTDHILGKKFEEKEGDGA